MTEPAGHALSELFDRFDASVAEAEEIETRRALLTEEQSDLIRRMLEANGGRARLRRRGEELLIVRSTRGLYFFRKLNGDGVTEVG